MIVDEQLRAAGACRGGGARDLLAPRRRLDVFEAQLHGARAPFEQAQHGVGVGSQHVQPRLLLQRRERRRRRPRRIRAGRGQRRQAGAVDGRRRFGERARAAAPGAGDRRARARLRVDQRVEHAATVGQRRRDAGRVQTAGAVGATAIGQPRDRGRVQRIARDQPVDAGVAVGMAPLEQHRARAPPKQPARAQRVDPVGWRPRGAAPFRHAEQCRGFVAIGRDHAAQARQAVELGRRGALEQRLAAGSGGEHRIPDHRQRRLRLQPRFEFVEHRAQHVAAAEHAQLDRRDRNFGAHAAQRVAHQLRVAALHALHAGGTLHGQRGAHAGATPAASRPRGEVGGEAGATGRVVAGNAQQQRAFGAAARRAHGAGALRSSCQNGTPTVGVDACAKSRSAIAPAR
ncbi:hypothetical protein GALL_491790 [mine drainage metagenome]|uniref:Uncharacterized protein n=1 Tax=mine drainage metagenome TaxID=410659 RepID=A0A1J5Q023_9ZZZZ